MFLRHHFRHYRHESAIGSGRTKAALQAKRAQGAILGKPENLTAEAQKKGAEATKRNAALNKDNRRASSVAEMMHKAGKNYSQIAQHLNQSGFLTVHGCEFQATQVMRLIKRKAVSS